MNLRALLPVPGARGQSTQTTQTKWVLLICQAYVEGKELTMAQRVASACNVGSQVRSLGCEDPLEKRKWQPPGLYGKNPMDRA